MNKAIVPLVLASLLCASLLAADTAFVSIFDSTSLKGWHPSAKTGHSRASSNRTAGK